MKDIYRSLRQVISRLIIPKLYHIVNVLRKKIINNLRWRRKQFVGIEWNILEWTIYSKLVSKLCTQIQKQLNP